MKSIPFFLIKIFAACVTIFSVSTALAQNTFYKILGTPNDDIVSHIERCADGGYFLCGSTHVINTYRSDAFAIRTDSSGNILWNKMIVFDSTSVWFNGGSMLSDGSFILMFDDNNLFQFSITIIMKLNPQGDTVWTRTLPDIDLSYSGRRIIPLPNGEFLMGGRHQFFPNIYDGFVTRFDSSGNTIYTSKFNTNYEEVFFQDFALTPDNTIVVACNASEYHVITHPSQAFILNLDLNGNFISGETYRDSIDVSLFGILPNPDYTYSVLFYQKLITTDTSGTILNSKKNIGNGYVASIVSAPDSGFIFQGVSYASPDYLMGVARSNPQGDTLWTKTYLCTANIQALLVNPADKSFTFTSYCDTVTNILGNRDIALLKADSTGNVLCYSGGPFDINFQPETNTILDYDSLYILSRTGPAINFPTWHQITFQSGFLIDTICSPLIVQNNFNYEIALSPNPVSENTFKIFTGGRKCDAIRMMTLDGKVIESAIQEVSNDANEITIKLFESVKNGMYLLVVSSSGMEFVVKMVVLRS